MSQLDLIVLSYLLGSIPFSYIITKARTGMDIREMGSKNVGATNVMRTAGRAAGILALILDVAKGAAVVLLARKITGAGSEALAGFAAMVGHSYPIFLRFRGGKSVATGGGAFLLISPMAILCCIATFLGVLAVFRIVSLASIIAAASFPLFGWMLGASTTAVLWGALSAALIIFRHKTNISHLMQGTERKIGEARNA